jgi:sporulation protein YlmC with PRC-barrel domain
MDSGVESVRTLSSIVRRKVVTEGGEDLGRCYDVRGELTQSRLTVKGLVIGRRGRLEHFGIGAQASASSNRVRDGDVIPWDAIVRFEAETIVVRDPWGKP